MTIVELPSGQVYVESSGAPDGELVLCVHGLSANCRSFAGKHVVAMDLRGRGHSQTTASGSFGWANHADDLVALADRYQAATFGLVGHSMGGFIGLDLAVRYPQRCRRLVLLDAAGRPEQSALAPIGKSVARLGKTYPSVEEYLAQTRANNVAITWDAFWEAYFRWETVELPEGGVGLRTSLMAVTEDATYGAGQDVYAWWPKVHCPTLLLRAARPMAEGVGFVVAAADAARFAEMPQAKVVEIDANHYTIVVDPAAIGAIAEFLG
ncbi:MAG TPA: alpha/beta hydrolase [Jatrophihabitans sp.]|nr:alpha/beta hydrolase [Jatrophihabitans sp.]